MRRTVNISMALVLLGWCSGVSAQQETKSAAPASALTKKIELSEGVTFANLYREEVLKCMARGETVSVPAEKIGYLDGAVRFISPERTKSTSMQARTLASTTSEADMIAKIDTIAVQLQDPQAMEGLKSFARRSSSKEKIEFLYFGKMLDLQQYMSPTTSTKNSADKPKEDCYDSCQTLCHVSCHEVCSWDCRIVNGEKVCEESCKTICPEVCNIVCHQVCR